MNRKVLLVTRNLNDQAILTNETINQGSVYRKFLTGCNCIKPITNNGTTTTINATGMYKISVEATFTAPAPGVVTLTLFENGIPLTGAFASETISTATTETRSMSFSTYVVVDQTKVLGINAITPKTYTLVNTGAATTFSRVQVVYENVL